MVFIERDGVKVEIRPDTAYVHNHEKWGETVYIRVFELEDMDEQPTIEVSGGCPEGPFRLLAAGEDGGWPEEVETFGYDFDGIPDDVLEREEDFAIGYDGNGGHETEMRIFVTIDGRSDIVHLPVVGEDTS